MFAHGGWAHIILNMLALFVCGVPVEKAIGTKEFLLFYFVSGILAGVVSFVIFLFTAPQTFLLGASGAIFAVQLAFAVIYPRARMLIWGIIPMRAPVMVLVFTALELVQAVTGTGAGVAHLTHLAGFATGWLYLVVRFGVKPWKALTMK
jgi:membrane associated rhomboid family serine protease